MDIEQRERRQSRRVIISEILMVIAVIATVVVLALVVSGYWLNSDFKVERQGLLQISSVPTGATVEIDGETSWLQRTNTSKVLAAGEHTVKLTKEGYDSWSKTVNVAEGLLYRIHYPRLFLNTREKTEVYSLSNATLATVTPSRAGMLIANNTTDWILLNLENEKLEPKTLSLPADFPFVSRAEGSTSGLFSGEIVSADWARDNEHLLLSLKSPDGNIEWVILNVKNPASTVNLTQTFNMEFSHVQIVDHSASNLLVVSKGDLHRVDVSARQISAVLVAGVQSFDYYDSTVVFANESMVGLMRFSDKEPAMLEETDGATQVTISRFYDDEYITVLKGARVVVHRKADFASEFIAQELSFAPTHIKVGHNGEFIMFWNDEGQIATLDMEAQQIAEWKPSAARFGWLDSDMIYSVAGGALTVYDFDGLNPRVLAQNVSSHFPVTITADKWLYYVSDGELVREWVMER